MSKTLLFEGQKIRLRAFEPEDAQVLLVYLKHPWLAGRRYIPWSFPADFPLSKKQAEAILQKWSEEEKGIHLAVERLDNGSLVGHLECEWEWDPHCPFVAVVIDPAYQSQGYGSEAVRLLLDYLFRNTPAHNISSWISDWNTPALAFARQLGFQESGRFRRDGYRDGRYTDGITLDILRPEWERCSPALDPAKG